jgi:hypothetical protein
MAHLQQHATLEGHGGRHGEDELVALRGRHKCEPDTCPKYTLSLSVNVHS